jgi:hypothetical protein
MGEIKKQITIDEEDIMHLQHCLARTYRMWEMDFDLWPFTIRSIIERYENDTNLR